MSEHPNAVRTREGFDRFIGGDVAGLLQLFADDAVWHVPGANAMTGEVVADDVHVVAVYRARGEREGRSLDIEQALLVTVEDGLWKDIRAQPLDQPAFDAFWA